MEKLSNFTYTRLYMSYLKTHVVCRMPEKLYSVLLHFFMVPLFSTSDNDVHNKAISHS